MMKKTIKWILAVVLCLSFAIPAAAIPSDPLSSRLRDFADLLSVTEEELLFDQLNDVSEKWEMDVVIVTTSNTLLSSVEQFSDDFYDQGNYSPNGILLLASMEERDVIITPYQRAQEVFSNPGCEYILQKITDDLSNGNYFEAFDTYVEQCDFFLEQAAKGEPFVSAVSNEPMPFLKCLVISLVIGLVAALIVTGVMKSKLKSVNAQSAADHYVRSGSLKLVHQRDLFLYRNISRVPKPKDNSGGHGFGRGSSGSGRAGAKGKF
jgi:uncharacterized protein